MNIKRNLCIFTNRIRSAIPSLNTMPTISLCDEIPDSISADNIYVSGDDHHMWYMALQCPCGCGESIYLNLVTTSRPCWNISWNLNGTITVYPSIWRTNKCRSHFFMRKGKIIWCSK